MCNRSLEYQYKMCYSEYAHNNNKHIILSPKYFLQAFWHLPSWNIVCLYITILYA